MGEPAYRARQLRRALFVRRVATLDEVTDFPLALRERLAAEHGMPQLVASEVHAAEDGTTKYLFELHDGARIESVALPRATGRTTYCLSSQVGCRMGCVFCATGRMGIVRQLSQGEIVGQVLELMRRHPSNTNPNLVFMGMGEPFDNLEALLPALRTLTEEVGLSARRITVSTSGLVDGIEALDSLDRPIGLAISLTTGDAEERRRLMPVAGQIPIEVLLATAARYGRRHRRKVTLECAIIAGHNDDERTARSLLERARGGPFKVNLIPLNPIDDYAGGRPRLDAVHRMAELIWENGVVCTVRDSQGREVEAACGQLVHRQDRRREEAPRRPALGPRRST